MIGPPAGSFDKKADKKRSPFAPFKRSDSSREMQIPESPTAPTMDRPGTSLTEEESPNHLTVSQDRGIHEADAPTPTAHAVPSATDGTLIEEQTRSASTNANVSH